jgi:glycosyltransferase involved in cell wall biosynthesis
MSALLLVLSALAACSSSELPPLHISVEGWRALPHSYAIVNQFQLLALLERSDVRVSLVDKPFYKPTWVRVDGMLPADKEALLAAIPQTRDVRAPVDVVLRMFYPLDLRPAQALRDGQLVPVPTWVFGTTEVKTCIDAMRAQREPEWADIKVNIWTPSAWSRAGFLRSAVPAPLLHVVPHGVDTALFKPLGADARAALRRRLGWEGEFVFLSIGAMTAAKGVEDLLGAFAKIVAAGTGTAGASTATPPLRLVLKGHDMLYNSSTLLGSAPREQQRVQYLGASLTFAQVAELFQAADAYVSPYRGEGFNMPVLEAAACGLPVVVTRGGATDDFVDASFALRVDSTEADVGASVPNARWRLPSPEHLATQMRRVVDDRAFVAAARAAGPAYVAAKFTWTHAVDKLVKLFRASEKQQAETCDWM